MDEVGSGHNLKPESANHLALWRRTAWILFVVLGLVFFWEVLFRWPSGQRYFWDDFLEFSYPTRFFAASSIAAGELPFWNPHVFAGMPFLADIQSAVFYPLNLLLSLFVPDGHLSFVAVEALAVVHVILAGCWTFLLMRRLGASVWGGWAAGITFMFSGFLVTHIIHLNVIEVAIWLPLAFLLLHMAFAQGSLRYALATGVVLAISFLGGSPQIALLCYTGLGLFTVYMTGRALRRTSPFRASSFKVPVLAAVAVIFSLGLCLFQILPSYELSQLSIRPELSYQQSVEASFPPQNLVTFFIPHFFGGTAGGEFMSYWGVGRYYYFWEMCGYVGIIGLLLAWIGLRRSERPHRGFFAALVLISLLMASGRYAGIHRLLFWVVPGYNLFRIPARALMLLVFAVSVLAGFGTDAFVSDSTKDRAGWQRLAWQWGVFLAGVLGVGLVLFRFLGLGQTLQSGVPVDWHFFIARATPFVAFGALSVAVLAFRARGYLSGVAAGVAVIGLLTADLFVFGRSHNLGTKPVREHYLSGEIVKTLRPADGDSLFRVQTRPPIGVVVISRNQGEIDGFFNVDGYNQLKLNLYETFDVDQDLKLDILNTRYRLIHLEGNVLELFEATTYLPRVFVVSEVYVADTDEAALDRMREGDFDPRRAVVLMDDWESRGPLASELSRVDIVSYGSNRIEVDAHLDGSGILVFSEIYYPYWVAYVDGTRTPILRADYALRAIPMESGTHRVVLVYESAAFRKGLFLSGICLVVGVLIAVVGRSIVKVGPAGAGLPSA
jgi:hypothetical protein